jgi:effector-binding domain-containing protein
MTVPGVNVESIYGRDRMGAFKFHLDALRKRMEWVNSMKTKLSKEEFLLIDFEGLVNNYAEYKKVIENFIGDANLNHINPGKYFDPIQSKTNTGIYKNILNNEELGLLKEFDFWYNKMIIQNQIKQNSILKNVVTYNNGEK